LIKDEDANHTSVGAEADITELKATKSVKYFRRYGVDRARCFCVNCIQIIKTTNVFCRCKKFVHGQSILDRAPQAGVIHTDFEKDSSVLR
jgi:hypothetical protein